jgi:long-chain acyl-CoA synthetase
MQGYLNKPEATAAAVRDGGLWTGDIGQVDPDGFVHITGRAKDKMIVGGENVFPFEIESVLVGHPSVAEAAVIGAADELRGEVPVAFVILKPEALVVTDNELRAYCRDKLAGYKVPRQVLIRAELPRGPTGKILKRALRMSPA